ncbi:MAG: hypothetical protein J5563_02130 [Clostridia bacterium]|nr:hypothetical protein [Clostridia bacterium]
MKEQKTISKTEKICRAAVIVLTLLICSAGVLFFVLWSSYGNLREEFASYRSKVALAGENGSDDLSTLRMELRAAEQARALLEKRIAELEDSTESPEELDELKAELEKKDAQISMLVSDLRAAGKGFSVDLSEQLKIVNEIEELIAGAPKNSYVKNLRTEQGVPVTDQNGKPIYDTIVTSPRISVAYYDLSHGFSWDRDGDREYPADGIEMPALALGLLKTALSENQRALSGTGYTASLTLNEDIDGRSASALVADMLRSGDRQAYNALIEKYGASFATDTLALYGIRKSDKGLTMTAKQACAMFSALYETAEKSFGPCRQAYDALLSSDHSVITGMSFSDPVAHFFIWGETTYTDLAVVCGEKPFALSLLTDMAGGGDKVNTFLRGICERVAILHENFYKKQQEKTG